MQSPEKWKDLYVPPANTKSLLTKGKSFKSIHDWELSEKDKERARVELGETEEKVEKCLCELKEKLSNDKNFTYRADDFYLLRFLRIRKYDCKKSYECMKRFYQMRTDRPSFFAIPTDLKSILDRNVCTILPYTDGEGRTMIWLDVGLWNPEEYSCDEMIQFITILLDIVTLNPKVQINGTIGVWDMSGLSFNHVVQLLKNNSVFALLSLTQSITAWRIHKLVAFNTGRTARFLYSLLRPLLSRKIAERMILLGSDMNELYKYVDPLLLPEKLGGTLDEKECFVTDHIMNNLRYIEYERSFSLK